MLTLFDLLQLSSHQFAPEKCKLHLARPNDNGEHPLEVFKRGEFDEWQSLQRKRNFTRPFVAALVIMPGAKWLFAGIYSVDGQPESVPGARGTEFKYPLTKLDAAKAPSGRIVVEYDYRQRQSYPYAENHKDKLVVSEILSEAPSISDFKGFRDVDISLLDLQVIFNRSLPDWRAALSSVKGVYLITEPETGKAYIGKADGIEGFWGRFATYAKTLHGTNLGLIGRMEDIGVEVALNWRLTILEVVSLYASEKEVITRENFWKKVLMTHAPYGYNHN
ncbi:MAG: GIY-YIG nuclease family protein [Asticcacaulis sp.]|uniref:GIY-YIG nuclease family protein n=1 Tax=Asticcacaulis sp. TaxID=1872648 RepID=UPI003F7BF948